MAHASLFTVQTKRFIPGNMPFTFALNAEILSIVPPPLILSHVPTPFPTIGGIVTVKVELSKQTSLSASTTASSGELFQILT